VASGEQPACVCGAWFDEVTHEDAQPQPQPDADMVNPLSTYRDTGRRAGRAMRQQDYRLASSLTDWLDRACRLETLDDGRRARQAYREGYIEEAYPLDRRKG
jgi:hypothetical protein